MSIHQLTRERLFTVTQKQRQLHPGQIIQGEILKIHPNNKAQIQLGSERMIAQLEASLAVGERYHFQVQSASKTIHLKVIGEQLTAQSQVNVSNLMDSLHLKTNRMTTNFVQALINDKIPFEKERLVQAFELINQIKRKPGSDQIVRSMIANKLPLTDSVFRALHTNSVHKFSEESKALLHQLRQGQLTTPLKQNLINQLSQLVERPLNTGTMFAQQIIGQSANDQQQLFTLLKNIGMIRSNTDFETWKSELLAHVNQRSPSPPSLQMTEANVRQALQQINTNKAVLMHESKLLLQQWGRALEQAMVGNRPLTTQNFTKLKQHILQHVLPLLSEEHGQQVQSLQNNRVQINQLNTLFQTLANEQTYTRTDQLLANINTQEMFAHASVKDQFLTQVRNVLSSTGLTYEHALMQSVSHEDQASTIKSMLIQLTQQGDGVVSDRAQHLLHMINGLQLQSVNETNNFIQASLLIPGEKLNLNSDLYLDFESQKTEDGEINPNYCRILFYLDLTHLNETIIDMNIQKRLVTITVFNDYGDVKQDLGSMKQSLKEGLSALDYQLVTVAFKPLQQVEEQGKSQAPLQSSTYQNSYEGFDYRV